MDYHITFISNQDYLDAVDLVCIKCGYPFDKTLEEWDCESCPVRMTVNMLYEEVEDE